jgi:hypothetical protein
MPGGRPSVLTSELIEKARKYIYTDGEPAAWKSVMGMVIPTIENFALYLCVHRDTVYSWERESKEFSDIVEAIRQDQASMLVSKGLSGEYNASIAKLLLSSKHGYVEKSETDLKSSDGSMSPKESADKTVVDKLMDQLKEQTAKEA